MQKHFYVSHNSKDLGPFTKEEINSKVKAKELFPSDYVYIEEKDDWVMLSDFIGEQTKKQSQPPAPTVTPKVETPTTKTNQVVAEKHNASVRFDHGTAKVSLRNEKAGRVKVEVDSKNLEVVGQLEIEFHAGDAHRIQWEGSTTVTVGQPLKLTFKAYDKFGNFAEDFNGSLKLEGHGGGEVKFLNGAASREVKHTKSESVEYKLSSSATKMDLTYVHRVNFKAGPAAKIHIDTKGEATVGEEVFITVKALDAYGNLATDFNDTVTVKLAGSSSEPTAVKLNQGSGQIRVS